MLIIVAAEKAQVNSFIIQSKKNIQKLKIKRIEAMEQAKVGYDQVQLPILKAKTARTSLSLSCLEGSYFKPHSARQIS